MVAYKMAAVKVTPSNDYPLSLIRSHMIVIHLFLMLCDLQRVEKDLCSTLYNYSDLRLKFSKLGWSINWDPKNMCLSDVLDGLVRGLKQNVAQ